MKLFLFKTLATLTGLIISLNLAIGNSITSIVATIFNGANIAVKTVAEMLMKLIDEDRYEHASLATKQSGELLELNLLMAANKVKEDAIATKTWTIGHTVALNKIGQALYMSCNWEPSKIHKYFRPLVQSIPGMNYLSGDDFEEKDPV
jgi:hypothetical protein